MSIKWYHHVRNDDVRQKTEQLHLLASATVQARHLSLYGHIAWMPYESDAKQILTASSWWTGGGHWDAPYYVDEDYPAGPEIIEPLPEWRKWCLHLVLCTDSGACQKWMIEWMPLSVCRCLAWYGYTLWFIQLPMYLASSTRHANVRLHEAFTVLQRMHELGLQPLDEVCRALYGR